MRLGPDGGGNGHAAGIVRNHLEGFFALYYEVETGRQLRTAAEVNELEDMISYGNTD